MQKNEAQISRFALLGKAPILLKKIFLKKKKKKEKKSLQLICADNIFKIFGGNFFKIKWSRDI